MFQTYSSNSSSDNTLSRDDEKFSVEEMLDESTDSMLLDNVETSLPNIPVNTTNWYETTLIYEMEAYSTNFCRNDEQLDSHLQEKVEEIKNSYDIIDEQCKDQRTKILRLIRGNEALKENIRRLEILLTRGDEQTICLREKVKNASLTFDKLNKGKTALNDVLSLLQSNGSGLGFNKLNDTFPKLFESKKDVVVFSKEKRSLNKKIKSCVSLL